MPKLYIYTISYKEFLKRRLLFNIVVAGIRGDRRRIIRATGAIIPGGSAAGESVTGCPTVAS